LGEAEESIMAEVAGTDGAGDRLAGAAQPDQAPQRGGVSAALRRVLAEWEAATADRAPACGPPAAVAAYRRMCQAWSVELAAQAATLDDLAGGRDGR
jgi:hypothetical protein